ncbi:putative peroxisome biogenesis protein 22 isoform X2 [Iris pallida]|uniref:Peroxisome biogenesis protein 22 isoform X2 n=1 Tax=Iris pallida TaxID=29817 RepID=A0AAX6DLP8_IRIPA|nr:putative peroxisome biogenesis protein 22 isoform X2 [Iris pallida]
MADPANEEFSDLIQRFFESLAGFSDRLPFDLDRQRLRSITTFAALSVAIVFAWKLLRSPPEHQRRQYRRRNSASGPSNARLRSDTGFPSSEACSPLGDLRVQDAVDDFFRPVNLTLEQLVRHQLNEGRKVTCQLLGVILEESSPEDLQKHATVRSSVREVLLEITKICDLYLMERVLDDDSEERVLSALNDAGLFTTGGLTREKVLFCSTENGRTSFVRQLEPDWHIDSNHEIIHQLSRFIKYLLHISPKASEQSGTPNVYFSTSLEQFFGVPGSERS